MYHSNLRHRNFTLKQMLKFAKTVQSQRYCPHKYTISDFTSDMQVSDGQLYRTYCTKLDKSCLPLECPSEAG